MRKRNTQVRRHAIAQMVQEQGQVSVEVLSELFETSEVTIRKDLTSLEQNGQLLRRYGGAVALPQEVVEGILYESDDATANKAAIANAAAELVKDHHRIVIDYGSTTGTLVSKLADKKGLVIMTNSLSLANQINELENEPTLLMTGGTWDSHSESFQGQVAESVLRSYDFDQLFIGADGVDIARGTTTFNELMGLSQVMAEVAREVVVMIESEKIGRKIPNLELAWEAIDIVVTDRGIDSQIIREIESNGVKVICAE
ncbi:DeoR/GlpR family DNA-binding transcription regulator [Vibrio hippocampi]|uniref:DeoR/GlpR family DNA-binding transcription regulator n=1 Tax=Vibrio hippocampi TaxID=654686 RepID=UPI001F024EE2|nr:DeoR family transcriptional regulator [Vibrio hippocampi]